MNGHALFLLEVGENKGRLSLPTKCMIPEVYPRIPTSESLFFGVLMLKKEVHMCMHVLVCFVCMHVCVRDGEEREGIL